MEEQVIQKLRELTGHKQVRLTDRGNSAIFIALQIAKQAGKTKLLIPDQGGWLTYRDYPKKFGLELEEIKTDYGVINLKDLKQKADKNSVLILAGLAGYLAEQPLQQISEICRAVSCLFIEDASGSIGNKKLCKGEFSDIIIGSFGRWKPVNLEYGGFISTNNKNFLENSSDLFEGKEFDELRLEELDKKLDEINQRTEFLRKTCEKVKQELSDFEIVHKDQPGIVVVVKFSNEETKQKIIKYCEQNDYDYTECPRYIRINEDAISIEIKRLSKN